MRRHHVGVIVIVDREDREPRPLGMITDRDIVIEVIAFGLNPSAVTVGDVLSGPVRVVHQAASREHALRTMTDSAVRRLPVVNGAGGLVGLISTDDLLPELAREISSIANLPVSSSSVERRLRKNVGITDSEPPPA